MQATKLKFLYKWDYKQRVFTIESTNKNGTVNIRTGDLIFTSVKKEDLTPIKILVK
jgi:hypothetical protein